MLLRSGFQFSHLENQSQTTRRRRAWRKSYKVGKYLRKKKSREAPRQFVSPVWRKAARPAVDVNTLLLEAKSRVLGAGYLAQWARESLSRRFVPSSQRVDPQEDLSGQGKHFQPREGGLSNEPEMKAGVERKRLAYADFLDPFGVFISNGVRYEKLRHAVSMACVEVGIKFIGPVPIRILQITWEHFGEELFSEHGRACWCRSCRSIGPARHSFVQRLGGEWWAYLVKMPIHVIKSLVVPAPLRMAWFVANKLWKWLNIIYG